MTAAEETTRLCTYCGYDLRGLGNGGKCPECGRRQRRWRKTHKADPLAHESYSVIFGCLWRAVLSLVSFAVIAVSFVLGPLHGGETLLWCLALMPFPLAVSTIVRGSPALVSPLKRENENSKRIRQGIRIAGFLLLAVGAIAVVLVASSGGGQKTLVLNGLFISILSAGAISICIGVAGVVAFFELDYWTLDDRAERLHGLSIWMLILVGMCIPVVLGVFGMLLGSTPRPYGIVFIGVVGWWLLVILGDLSVISSVVWCLRHRMHYDEIQERKDEREDRAGEEVRRRVKAMDQRRD